MGFAAEATAGPLAVTVSGCLLPACYFRFIIRLNVTVYRCTILLCDIKVIFLPNWSTRLGGNTIISPGKWMVLAVTPLPHPAYTDTHTHTQTTHARPCETCSSSGQMMTDSNLHAVSPPPTSTCTISSLFLSLSIPPSVCRALWVFASGLIGLTIWRTAR